MPSLTRFWHICFSCSFQFPFCCFSLVLKSPNGSNNQMWRSGQNRFRCSEEEQLEEKHRLSDQWMTMKQWEKTRRASSDQREMIKTVEIDTSRPYSYTNLNFQRSQNQSYHYHSDSSPLRRRDEKLVINSRTPPSPSKTKPLQVHSASPRCPREERDSTKAQTSNLRSVCYDGTGANADSVPNYMNATESAKARARSQSAPRHRPVTPEKEKLFSAKKRLSFRIPDPYNGVGTSEGGYEYYLRSPNCKNRYREHSGMEQRSPTSSVYDYLGDEVSSPSISGGRRWLKWDYLLRGTDLLCAWRSTSIVLLVTFIEQPCWVFLLEGANYLNLYFISLTQANSLPQRNIKFHFLLYLHWILFLFEFLQFYELHLSHSQHLDYLWS